MTAKKTTPAKRGRKPAPPELRTEPFTVRLTPKLRSAIELLARAQRGRTFSQVVEWAIQRGVNSVTLGTGEHLGSVLDELALCDTEWDRLRTLYELAPGLLDFTESAICDTIYSSPEYKYFCEHDDETIFANAGSEDERYRIADDHEFAFHELIERHWEKLKTEITAREAQGKSNEGISIQALASISEPIDTYADLRRHLDAGT